MGEVSSMRGVQSQQEPYRWDPVFEKMVVTAACSNPSFYGRIGHMIDPELLKYESSKWAMKAAHVIFKENGQGPSSCTIVIQRLRLWMNDGKLTLERIKKVAALFDAAEDDGIPKMEDLINELRPVIQQRIRDEAVQLGIESFGKKGDLRKVVLLEEKAQRVGIVDTNLGTIMGPASWREVAEMRNIERLPIGISELDSALDGGLQRGGLGIWIGGAGDGKSMALSHTCGFNVCKGGIWAYATLELPRPEILARVKACMTGIPINALKAGEMKAAKAVFKAMHDRVGSLVVREFAPLVTVFEDIEEWIKQIEDHYGQKLSGLFVDYGDKLGARKAGKSKDDESGYTTGRVVFERMRLWAAGEATDDKLKRFCWTASQATRRKDRKKRLDIDDAADSMHKVRVGDLVITLNVKDGEPPEIELFVGKHRTGRNRFALGPYPTAYEIGQIVPIGEV
jgi:hypothetical protein